jgi:hypothetical protein
MSGVRNKQSLLWSVDLKEAPKTNYKPACNHARETSNLKEAPETNYKPACNHARETSNLKELINYLHATAFRPVKSTWVKAIKNGNFASWPGLTKQAVEKHLTKSVATVKDI